VAGWNFRTVGLTALGLVVVTCGGVACAGAFDDGDDAGSEHAVEACRDRVRSRIEYPDLAAFSPEVDVGRTGHRWVVRSAFEPERTVVERSFTCEVDDRGGWRVVHLRIGDG